MRRYVIGDLHGCSKALRTMIEELSPSSDDQLIFLGDYIDRGPDSRDVVDQLLSLSQYTRTIYLRGNHELMLLGVLLCGCDPKIWMQSGGLATLASYGGSLAKIPVAHVEFFQSLRPHYETEEEAFIHAGYVPDVPIDKTDDATRYWNHLTGPLPAHVSGKRVFVGHTPQANGAVLNVGHFVCVDTYCFGGGWLTAFDLDSEETVQVSRHGHTRRDVSTRMGKWWQRWFGIRRGSPTKAGDSRKPSIATEPGPTA